MVRGTRNGIPAARIFRFARTRRCAIAGSATRKACAISVVVRPPTSRSVSATRLSGGERGVAAGEDEREPLVGDRAHVVLLGRELLEPAEELGLLLEDLLAADPVDRAVARGRDDPGARACAAVPSRGQRSSAVVNASCTASSASSRSPRTRVRIATALPHSSRKTRSTSGCTAGVIAEIGRISIEPCFAAGMSAASRIASSRSGRSTRKTPPRTLLRLRERAVGHDALAVADPHDLRACCGRRAPCPGTFGSALPSSSKSEIHRGISSARSAALSSSGRSTHSESSP